jgi:MoaA/NifB/PqqE/SkfB family radical SAM enzyme
MKTYFALKKDVILVQGAKRGLIQDLNKNKIFSIDESSKNYLDNILNGNSIENALSNLNNEVKVKFINYLNLLVKNNLGYYSDEKIISGKYIEEKQISSDLVTVWLELRKSCNLNCCHCYMDCTINSDLGLNLLTITQWKLLIEQLEVLNPKKVILIGGEPLLFKDIVELINYCRLKCSNSELVLYSNLTLLSEEVMNCILKNNVKVVTSIYSNIPEIHDKITRTDGSFLRTTYNINRLKKLGIYVQANTVVMSYNYKIISSIQEYTYKLTGVRGKIDIIRDVGTSKEYLIPKELLYEMGSRVQTTSKFMHTDKEKFLRNYSGNSCWQGKINITCDGKIGPCIMGNRFINSNFNVVDNSLDQILDYYIIPEFWEISKDYINDCKVCEYRYVCLDCRPIHAEENNKYSKGKQCTYNPYLGIWGI